VWCRSRELERGSFFCFRKCNSMVISLDICVNVQDVMLYVVCPVRCNVVR
jgi:hypothetical protein